MLPATLVPAVVAGSLLGQLAAQTVPDMANIPAGDFTMGSGAGDSWERPAHQVRTPAFRIGVRPVSNAQFRTFRPDHESPANNADSAPVTGVSWDDAQAYCEWLSRKTGRPMGLPSEARWERAARGGADDKKYPWGDAPAPDGSERINPFGVHAVSQNLWEWTADWYANDYYMVSPRDDPRGPSEGVYRVLRGGGYPNDPATATVYSRGSARPETRSERITFRVAVSGDAPPPPAAVTSVTRPAPPKPQPTAPAPRPTAPKPKPSPTARATAGASSALEVRGVDFVQEGGGLTVAVQTSAKPTFKAFALNSPDRVVVDVPGGKGVLQPATGRLAVGRNAVRTIRYSQFQVDPPIFRLVVDLDRPLNYRVQPGANQLRIELRPK